MATAAACPPCPCPALGLHPPPAAQWTLTPTCTAWTTTQTRAWMLDLEARTLSTPRRLLGLPQRHLWAVAPVMAVAAAVGEV